MAEKYLLKWNRHIDTFLNAMADWLDKGLFCDCTLSLADGKTIKCHKTVLAACSTYFANIFTTLEPGHNQVVVLPEIGYNEMQAVLQYIYRGEVKVDLPGVNAIMRLGKLLKIKGLMDSAEVKQETQTDSSRPATDLITPELRKELTERMRNGIPLPQLSTDAFESLDFQTMCALTQYAYHNGGFGNPLLNATVFQGFPIHFPENYPNGPSMPSDISPLERKKYSSMMANLASSNEKTLVLRAPQDQPGPSRSESSQPGSSRAAPSTPTSSQPGPSFIQHAALRDLSLAAEIERERRQQQGLGAALPGPSRSPPSDSPGAPEDYSSDGSNGKGKPGKGKCRPKVNNGNGNAHAHGNGNGNGNGNGKVKEGKEKKYKQYTKNNLNLAISAVEHGGISPLQAARRYGVPSRTLYDKVKKLGIQTPSKAGKSANPCDPESANKTPARCSAGAGPSGAQFPFGIGANVNGGIYNGQEQMEVSNPAPAPAPFAPIQLTLREPERTDSNQSSSTSTSHPESPPSNNEASNSNNENGGGSSETMEVQEGVEDLSVKSKSPKSTDEPEDETPKIKKEPEDNEQ